MRKWMIVTVVLLLIGVRTTPAHADGSLPHVEPSDCPIEVPQGDLEIECGKLVAPENYADLDGNLVKLPYIIIRTENAGGDQTPMLFTEGGPGGTSLEQVWGFYESEYVQDRDVIIFEQRGNHHAEPALACDFDEIYDREMGYSPCKEKFEAAGIDLTQYHTAVLAEDIESLRTALGYEQWNLFGTSYSTRLMQVLMDRHPEGIRSAILQAVNPLHETRHERDPEHSYRALQVMFEDCAADPDCEAAYPELEARFFALVAELNETPIKIEFKNPEDGLPSTFEVTGYTLIDWMVGRAFYGPTIPPFTTAYWPLFIDHLSSGKTDVLEPWALNEIKSDLFSPGFIAYGLYFTVNCQDDSSIVTLEQIEAQAAAYPEMDGYVRHYVEWEICQLWDLPPAPPLSDEPISSDIPTLVLSGRYDPITPPHWAQEVAENLENAFYVEFPSKGHSLDSGTTCAEEIKSSFLNDPWREPDTACLADEPRPTFVLTSEIVPEEGFATSLADIDFGVPDRGNPFFEALTGASLAVFVLEILVFIVLSFIVLFSPSRRKAKVLELGYLPHLAAGTAALLSITMVILLSLINQSEVVTAKTLRMFGYYMATPLVNSLGAVVIAQIICGMALIFLIIRAWMNQESTVLNRSALTLVALAVVTFWPFFFRWDLVNLLFFRLTG